MPRVKTVSVELTPNELQVALWEYMKSRGLPIPSSPTKIKRCIFSSTNSVISWEE